MEEGFASFPGGKTLRVLLTAVVIALVTSGVVHADPVVMGDVTYPFPPLGVVTSVVAAGALILSLYLPAKAGFRFIHKIFRRITSAAG